MPRRFESGDVVAWSWALKADPRTVYRTTGTVLWQHDELDFVMVRETANIVWQLHPSSLDRVKPLSPATQARLDRILRILDAARDIPPAGGVETQDEDPRR